MTGIDLAKLNQITTLSWGAHQPDGQMMCVMEAVAYVAGEPWSDSPACASPVIAAFLRRWNDDLADDAMRTRLLLPLIPRIIGTRSDDAGETRRAWMVVDWLTRSLAPTFLRLTPSLAGHAVALEALDEIVDTFAAVSAQSTIASARAAALAAREAALATGAVEAREAAREAALATGAASWATGSWGGLKGPVAVAQASAVALASWAAAGATALGATSSWAAAGGAAPSAALKGPIAVAQASAVALVQRMCEAGR